MPQGLQQKPRVIACGGRKSAYDQFCDALAGDAEVWLLVDAEELPTLGPSTAPWDHVKSRKSDGWERPGNARDDQLHLMTVCMETWLIADPAALKAVFGPKLGASKLPALAQLETTAKQVINSALAAATKPTKAGAYSKGSHSFKTLAKVSPGAVRTLSWGKRFLDVMGAAK